MANEIDKVSGIAHGLIVLAFYYLRQLLTAPAMLKLQCFFGKSCSGKAALIEES
jgi:hypothetical protein